MSQLAKNGLNVGRTIFTRSQRAQFSSNGLKVLHFPEEKEFAVTIDAQKAFLSYSRQGDLMELEHTEVPEVFRGKGVGKLLAQEAFEFVAKNDLKMKIHCDYAEKVFNDNKAKYGKYLQK
ncbi:protein NATD1-like [Culicoides brevitarsis]|uniref:protein NATD1-like n=1 Tax=Culicoides brevitarsis TaxID=469753 RepID=UPI00307C3477